MATYTPNYNLSKPESTDDYRDFLNSYGDNMDKIDNNMGGGGGGGGHTIVDPDGTSMPQENKLQFTGAVSVSDDSANGQTVVNVEGGGGNVYGAFFDASRVIYSSFVFDSSAHTWTATEDCILTDNMLPPDGSTAYFIRIDGKQVFAGYSTVEDPFVYVKKGQVVEYRAKSGSTMKAYGVTQGTNGIFAPVIYSDTERVIGVWRDGKPLYQKTIDIAPLPNRTTKEIQLDADIERVISMHGYGIDANDKWDVFLNDVVPTNVSGSVRVFFNTTTKKLYINTGENLTSYTEAYVTIQYTKTTDVAGSGNWNTDGVPTHHYSTNEQVIGTWIDGKPLYEKTYKITSGITFGGSYNYVALDSAIRVKKYDGYVMRTTGAIDGFVPYVSSINSSACNYIGIRTTGIEYTVMSVFQTDFDCVCFTLQYTKNTD